MSLPLRIAYAMINCNRRDGTARAVNEVAERMASKHKVHLFARRAEEIDLSKIKWHRMPGLSWPELLDFSRRLYLKTAAISERKAYSHRGMHTPPLFLPGSRGVEKDLRSHYDIGPAPVRIIPNAADTNIFKPLDPAERESWRQANGFHPKDIILIFAGG